MQYFHNFPGTMLQKSAIKNATSCFFCTFYKYKDGTPSNRTGIFVQWLILSLYVISGSVCWSFCYYVQCPIVSYCLPGEFLFLYVQCPMSS